MPESTQEEKYRWIKPVLEENKPTRPKTCPDETPIRTKERRIGLQIQIQNRILRQRNINYNDSEQCKNRDIN